MRADGTLVCAPVTPTEPVTPAERVWRRLLDLIEARDAAGAAGCFTGTGSWQNVPHPPAVGRSAIEGLLAPILRRSERVRWDVVTSAYTAHRGWLERVDRFWIDGVEYAVRCNGVFEVDAVTGLIAEWRDYVDLSEWRGRLGAAHL